MNKTASNFFLLIAAASVVLIGVTAGGLSQELQAQAGETRAGDIESGRVAAQICIACHGAEGLASAPDAPHLAGQHASYVARALGYYKSGERHEPGMQAIARELSDADMANLSVYYASLKPFANLPTSPAARTSTETSAAVPAEEDDPFAAIKGATAQCAGCHGDGGNSRIPGMPGLAGQHPRYLIAALTAYRDGSRPDPVMQAFAAALEDAMIEDMAFYYAAIKPLAAEAPTDGDPYAGRAATRDCATCHGIDGNTKNSDTPRLAGLDAAYIGGAIAAYKSGQRRHVAMQDAAANVRDADIADISAFYATKAPKALPVRKKLTTAQWVENCDRCHGPGGHSTDPRFPILAGQSETYLVGVLKRYHSGDRPNSMMVAMSYPMSQSDIRKLAAYYAAQEAGSSEEVMGEEKPR